MKYLSDESARAAGRSVIDRHVPRGSWPEAANRLDLEIEKAPALDLVGGAVAASILGVLPSRISKLRIAGRMPDLITVEGSYGGYDRREVEELAAQLKAESDEKEAIR